MSTNVVAVSKVTAHRMVHIFQGIKEGRYLYNQLTRFTEQVAPKFCYTSTQICDVTYQNTVIFKYLKSSGYVVKHPDVLKPSSWGEKN